jgi:hypothetical protein
MPLHALVSPDGSIVEFRDFEPQGDYLNVHGGKPRWLPVVRRGAEAFDEHAFVLEGPVYEVQSTQVQATYTLRPRSSDEIQAIRVAKYAEISAEFERRWQLPIQFPVGGQLYVWDADQQAVDNILGVLNAYREAASINITLPDPRSWKPAYQNASVTVTRADLVALGLAIANRKDVLFAKKIAKKTEVDALTEPADIVAYNALSDWD